MGIVQSSKPPEPSPLKQPLRVSIRPASPSPQSRPRFVPRPRFGAEGPRRRQASLACGGLLRERHANRHHRLPGGRRHPVFTLHQEGSALTGNAEGLGGGFFGGSDAGIPIEEGKVNGQAVSFKVGNSTFAGTLKGDQLELTRTIDFSRWLSRIPKEPTGPRPAIGPPPDGTDPSFNIPTRIPIPASPSSCAEFNAQSSFRLKS